MKLKLPNTDCANCGAGFFAWPYKKARGDGRFCSKRCRQTAFEREKRQPILDLFESKYIPEPNSGCWLWTGSIDPTGYGRFWTGERSLRAHRFSYEQHVGPIPAGMLACHHCDNRLCVNPEHLFVGTHLDNMRDCVKKGRWARGGRHGSAKLTEADIPVIRDLAQSRSGESIARKFGVTQRTINSIVKGRTWAHIATSLIFAVALLSASNATAASFTCGYAQCALNGISKAECVKRGLPLALNWASKFTRVSQPSPGIVVVQSRRGKALGGSRGGHVSRIVSVTGNCRAIVQDNRGRYERNVCRNLVAYVAPKGMWTE